MYLCSRMSQMRMSLVFCFQVIAGATPRKISSLQRSVKYQKVQAQAENASSIIAMIDSPMMLIQ